MRSIIFEAPSAVPSQAGPIPKATKRPRVAPGNRLPYPADEGLS